MHPRKIEGAEQMNNYLITVITQDNSVFYHMIVAAKYTLSN